MAAPIHQKQVNREAVRILALEHGLKRASELSGVAYETVKKWSQRQHWNGAVTHSQRIVPTVPIADAVASELREHERETRLSLARSARNMSKDAEALPVRHAKLAHTVAQTAAIVHNWSERAGNPGIVNLNVLADKSLVQIVDRATD